MPLNEPVHIVGMLVREPAGLVLRVDGGGYWQLDQVHRARDLIGQRVEVVGHRVGFNDIACDSVWRAGEPRPRPRRFGLEFLVPGLIALTLVALVAGSLG